MLGAWGCGVYGNPVREIGAARKKVILGPQKKGKERRYYQGGLASVKALPLQTLVWKKTLRPYLKMY